MRIKWLTITRRQEYTEFYDLIQDLSDVIFLTHLQMMKLDINLNLFLCVAPCFPKTVLRVLLHQTKVLISL